MKATLQKVARELRTHAPFTMLGAAAGIVLVWIIVRYSVPRQVSETMFWIFHPLHVYLSALTTAAMFRLHGNRGFWPMLCVGYVGSIGIATVSDSLIPYLAEWILDLPHRELHIGCAVKWWLVNPMALAGILTARMRPSTRFPHAGHVFLSTGASLFHVAMALGTTLDPASYMLITVFLFLAVWIPCCTSDIVFPLLFARRARHSPIEAVGFDTGTKPLQTTDQGCPADIPSDWVEEVMTEVRKIGPLRDREDHS